MKKLIAILLAALMLLSLAACGETPATDTTNTETAASGEESAAVAGETFDAGQITVTVPSGWTAIAQHDVFSDDPKAMLTDVVNVCKGGTTADDLFSKPYIRFDFGGANKTLYMADKDFYDDVVDLEPIVTGDHTWNGYSCNNFGYKTTVLFCEEGALQYQAMIYTEMSGGKISVDDADVQAILASVAPTSADDLAAASAEAPAAEPTETSSDSGDLRTLMSRFRGDWHGVVGFRDCTDNYVDLDGDWTTAIARFKVYDEDDGTLLPFIGLDVEDTPIEDLEAEFDVEGGRMLLSGKWISVGFEDIPAEEENGTLHFEIPISKDAGSLRLVFNLRRLDDTGWTDEDPRMSDEDATHCIGKTFDELAELNGYSFMDYPSEDAG
ncbi:MAG: hypothetical protein IJT18_07315 [Oscillospiraceae bacterium]|nr:hypothetical protein [Oscillospiraceae bacterium]